MADDIGREAVTLKGELAHWASLISISLFGQRSLCDNALVIDYCPELSPKYPRSLAPGTFGFVRIGSATRSNYRRQRLEER